MGITRNFEINNESKLEILKQRITKLATNEYEISLNHQFAVESNQPDAEKLAVALQGVRDSKAFHVKQYQELKLNEEIAQERRDEVSRIHNSAE